MEAFLAFVCDLMVWISLPILAVGGIWESQLAVSEAAHIVLRLLGLAAVYGWVWVWIKAGEARRLHARQLWRENRRAPDGIVHFTSPVADEWYEEVDAGERPAKQEGLKLDRRNYAGH